MPYSFELTPEQLEHQKRAREFAQRELAPKAVEIDRSDEMPWGFLRKMAKPPYNYTGLFIPKEYGGTALDKISIGLIVEELAYVSPVCAIIIETSGLGTLPITIGGSEEQKKRYLPPIANGDSFPPPAFGLTEPGAGSDPAAIEAVAVKEGDGYVLKGRKRFISNSDVADITLVFAKTAPEKGAKGISVFAVERGTPGLVVEEKVPCIGLRGHQDIELVLDNCKVPKDCLIGEEGKGLIYALKTLNNTRPTLACGYLGLARAALDASVKFASERKTFGKPLAERQSLTFPLVEIATEIEAARLLAYRAMWMADRGVPNLREVAMAKNAASEVMMKATSVAMAVFGGFGGTKRFPVERFYRDAEIWRYGQGSPEILKIIILRELFGRADLM